MLEIFPIEAGKGILIRVEQGETWLFLSFAGNLVFLSSGNGAPLQFWREPRCSSRVKTGMLWNFLSCSKGVKDPLEVQEGGCDFTGDAAAEKRLISLGGICDLWFSLEAFPQGYHTCQFSLSPYLG